jgi:MFS superfamily sulfate permease-like transporter
LPEATLGAIGLHALWSLFDVRALRRYRLLRRTDFWGACAALIGVLAFATLPGLTVAVAVSLLVMVYRASRPHVEVPYA